MKHEVEELSPEASAFLDEVRGADDPSDADRARIKRALLATVAGGVAASTAASSTAAASATTVAGTAAIGSSFSVAAKLAAVVIAIGAVGASAVILPDLLEPEAPAIEAAPAAPEPHIEEHAPDPSAPTPTVEATPEPESEAEPAPPLAEVTEVAEASVAPAPRAARTRPAEPTHPSVVADVAPDVAAEPAPSTLAQENALIGRAQRAINQGEPELALRHLSAHASRFPDGLLTEEREAARVLALCRADRQDEARELAARFLAERPASPLAARVRAACP